MTATDATSDHESRVKAFGLFEWMVARRYIGGTKKGAGISLISIIAFAGISFAVMALIVVMSVMQGFRTKLLEQLLGVNGHVFVEAQYGQEFTDYTPIVARIRQLDGITSAIPVVQGPVYAAAAGETGVIVTGITPDDLRDIDVIASDKHLVAGTLDTFGIGKNGGNQIVIGDVLAAKLGVGLGQGVTLITGSGANTPMGPTPRSKTYEVAAIFSIGMSEFDGLYVYMPLRQAQLYFNKRTSIDKIEIKIAQAEHVQAYRDIIFQATLPDDFTPDARPPYQLYDWRDVHESYFNALRTERFMMRIIMSMIVAIAMLNIITGQVMMVKDKASDIAIMRTMGATQRSIMRIFVMSGSLISLCGALTGVALGILICQNINMIENFFSRLAGYVIFDPNIYFLSELPAEVQFGEVAFICILSVALAFISTLYPAWRAASIDPVEALRYE